MVLDRLNTSHQIYSRTAVGYVSVWRQIIQYINSFKDKILGYLNILIVDIMWAGSTWLPHEDNSELDVTALF